jgi:uncharacterized membrane protein YdjX (TVP38/TMEM64 family)
MKNIPLRTLMLLALVLLAIIVPFCLFGTSVNAWTDRLIAQAGARPFTTGALFIALLASDIVMPVPSSLVSTACGLTLGFLGGTAASFIGMTLSATGGYYLGRYASVPAEKLIGKQEVCLLQAFNARHGVWVLLALRPVPVLAEASVLFSGLSRQPLPRVLAVTALGNLAVSVAYAAVGVWGRVSDSFLLAFGVSLLLSGLLLLWLRLKRARLPDSPAA